MRLIKQTMVWTIVIFIAMTLSTMKLQAHIDGINSFGFPFTFYNHLGGKCDDCYDDFGFNSFNFIADIFITLGLSYLLVKIKNKLVKQ